MFEWLSVHINEVSLLWLLPILFMFHDFEEILVIEAWSAKYGTRVEVAIPPFMRKMYTSMMHMTTRNFALDVLFVYILIVAVTCIAVFFSYYLLYLAVLAVFFFHVFTHLGQTIYLKMYTPGVVTAVLVVLPYSLYAYYRLLDDGVVSITDIGRSLVVVLLLLPPLMWLLVKNRTRNKQN
ncbi:HXXEE domain-containing protein [Paenibacillus sp. B-A-8]|uniref:HXXEE domain-containing protein n=1 Tax=Paenibacillus sp. B-A-8 TaxID=3400419 RepID=UPI003B01E355